MNWKSTVFLSGAGVLATWLAGVQSPSTTLPAAATVAPAASPAQAPLAASSEAPEIAQLADRLEQRNRAGDAFNRPARNLFRFVPRPARRVEAPQPAAPVNLTPQPTAPVIHLSGVAMDRIDDKDVWTAILSTPNGVVLAREGEDVVGMRVTAIGAESVSLTRADGSTLNLPLSGR